MWSAPEDGCIPNCMNMEEYKALDNLKSKQMGTALGS